MSGGHGKIKPSDNPKPFKKGNKAAEKWTEEKSLSLGEDLISWLLEKHEEGELKGQYKQNKYVEEFLVMEKGLGPDTINYLKNKFSTFSVLYARAMNIQKIKLIKDSVDGKAKERITQFILTNNHGMTEKVENKNDNTNTHHIIDFSKGD